MAAVVLKEACSFGSSSMNGSANKIIISSTHSRIAQLHTSLGVPPEAAIRPTEAQLRWAQFHSQKRASDTQQKIKKLYRYPLAPSDVRGVIPGEDDLSSSSYSADTATTTKDGEDRGSSLGDTHPPLHSIFIKRKKRFCNANPQNQQFDHHQSSIPWQHKVSAVRRRRPRISKGRKALLRVSARNYLQRKQQAKQIPVIELSDTIDSMGEMTTARKNDEATVSTSNELVTTPQRRNRARMSGRVRSKVFSHVQSGQKYEEERVQRFEEAFHAITLGLSTSNDNQTVATSSSTTTKRWQRQSTDASTVDFNSVSRFGSIGHPDMLLGVSSVILQRRNQPHVQGIELEHTDSWIRYIQSQQRQQLQSPDRTKSSITETIVENDQEEEERSEINLHPGEHEFLKLRKRLRHGIVANERRVTPDAYNKKYSCRKELLTSEKERKILAPATTLKEQQITSSCRRTDNRQHTIYCQNDVEKDLSRERQTLLDASTDRLDNDVSPEYLKKWKLSHDKSYSSISREAHSAEILEESNPMNSRPVRFKFDASADQEVEISLPISGSPICVVKGNSREDNFQQHLQSSMVSIGESRTTSSASDPAGIPEEAHGLESYLSMADDEHLKAFQNPEMVKKWLELNGDLIDDIESAVMTPTDVGEEEYRQRVLVQPNDIPSLILTPSLLTKRLRQCIRILENHDWEKASYLISANPWLIEMTDVLTGQVLLHALALHGETAPDKLNKELVEAFPSSVHKFDDEGNLGLHLAAESGNVAMIRLLGDKFPGGASVQNVSGLLPLHLAVLSGVPSAVREVASLFPGATAVQDNEGNLPLHLTLFLHGDSVIQIIRLLLLFDTPVRIQRNVMKSFSHETDFAFIDESDFDFPTTPKYMETGLVHNNEGCTPLVMAVRSMLGWEVVEALLKGSGGNKAALECSSISGENALHLAAMGDFADPSVVLTLLKFVPIAATIPNGDGILPIELVCMQRMPKEVILAVVLTDLPFDLQEEKPTLRDGYGKSWWFLVCDCDDEYHDVVKKVLQMCSYEQVRELCLMEGGTSSNAWAVISRATPKCRHELQKAQRFAGRYEFMDDEPKYSDSSKGLNVYEAFDFGSQMYPREKERIVTVKCYSKMRFYNEEMQLLREKSLDCLFVEEVCFFELLEFKAVCASEPQQYCVAIEKPSLTLGNIVQRAPKGKDRKKDEDRFYRYMKKVCAVLCTVAKALQYLHNQNVIHGDVSLYTSGKFGDNWKLMSIGSAKINGEAFPRTRLNGNSPPEAVRLERNIEDPLNALRETLVEFNSALIAEPTYDIWSFGKLCYEALSGESLFPFDPLKDTGVDKQTLKILGRWNERNVLTATRCLLDLGVTESAADLISRCLQPKKSDRPQSMREILRHEFWTDKKKMK